MFQPGAILAGVLMRARRFPEARELLLTGSRWARLLCQPPHQGELNLALLEALGGEAEAGRHHLMRATAVVPAGALPVVATSLLLRAREEADESAALAELDQLEACIRHAHAPLPLVTSALAEFSRLRGWHTLARRATTLHDRLAGELADARRQLGLSAAAADPLDWIAQATSG